MSAYSPNKFKSFSAYSETILCTANNPNFGLFFMHVCFNTSVYSPNKAKSFPHILIDDLILSAYSQNMQK
jgi:hypothetical protein